MQEVEKVRNELKKKIDLLRNEKSQIEVKNKEITIKHEQIKEAKNKIQVLEQAEQEIIAKEKKYFVG